MSADEIMNLADDFATTKARYWCSHVGVTDHDVLTGRGALEKAALALEEERDGLRKAAQMALEWFDWLNATTGPISPPHVAKDVQNALRKELSE